MDLWNAFAPYKLETWICLLIALALQCGFAALVAKVEVVLKLSARFAPGNVSKHFSALYHLFSSCRIAGNI